MTSAVGTGPPPSDHRRLTHTVTSPPTSQPDASILGSRMQSRLVEGGSGKEVFWAHALRRTQFTVQVTSSSHRVPMHMFRLPDASLLPCPRHPSP